MAGLFKLASAAAPASAESPERAVLAERIARRDAAQADVEAVGRALSAAQNSIYDRIVMVDMAKAAVDSAVASAVDHAIEVARGGPPVPPVTVKVARAAVTDAEDELRTARAAIARLEAEQQKAAGSLTLADLACETAAFDVIRASSEIVAVHRRFGEIQREWGDLARLYAWARLHRLIPPELPGYSTVVDSWTGVAGVQPWEAALAALKLDANAALPPA